MTNFHYLINLNSHNLRSNYLVMFRALYIPGILFAKQFMVGQLAIIFRKMLFFSLFINIDGKEKSVRKDSSS